MNQRSLLLIFIFAFALTSCEKDEEDVNNGNNNGVNTEQLDAQAGDPDIPDTANMAEVVATGGRDVTATANASMSLGSTISTMDLIHENQAASGSQVSIVRIGIAWDGDAPLAPGTYEVDSSGDNPFMNVPFKIVQDDNERWDTDVSEGRLVVTESTDTSMKGTLVAVGTWLEDEGGYRAAWAFNVEI
jgi:hypothetical protein